LLYLFLDFLHPNGEYPEMNSEDFWPVFLIVLAAALLWIVFNVFWGHDEHRRNIDLGIHQRADAVATREASFYGLGLAFLFGHPREKVLLLHLWLRFAVLWVAVVLIGFVEGYVLLPFGLASFLGGVFLTVFVIWRVAPKWLC
jgi:hypothetical protein